MLFVSIYKPSYARQSDSVNEFFGKYWHLLLLVLVLHLLVLSLWGIKPLIKSKLDDELVIDLSNPLVIPKRILDEVQVPRIEEKQSSALSQSENTKPAIPVQPLESPPSAESTPVVKFNEEVIKPIKAIKTEPVRDKPVLVPVEKQDERKVLIQSDAPVQLPVELKQAEVKQAEPKPAEVIAPTLPALVDKKNKDKDAPEVAQPSRGSGASSSASSDAARSGAASSPVSNSIASGAASGTQSGTPSGSQAASGGNEMQAQLSGSKSSAGPSKGNAGTADADYQSPGLRNAQPRYPIYARKMRQEGVVIVTADVLTDGSAIEVRIASSSGIKLLDEAALETVKQWNFTPARKDGIPYVQRLRIPVTFSLNSR